MYNDNDNDAVWLNPPFEAECITESDLRAHEPPCYELFGRLYL